MSPATSGNVAVETALPADVIEHESEGVIAQVCHKLRTPLTSALGFVQLCVREAAQQPDSVGQLRNLEIVEQQLRKLAHIIDELADKARLGTTE